jgi:hypothetical protein
MLEITERHLVKCGFRCCTIKGSIAAKHRTEIVESFNTDESGAEVLQISFIIRIQYSDQEPCVLKYT